MHQLRIGRVPGFQVRGNSPQTEVLVIQKWYKRESAHSHSRRNVCHCVHTTTIHIIDTKNLISERLFY